MTTNPQDLDALVERMRDWTEYDTGRLMECAIMAIATLRRDLLATGAAATERAAGECDTAAHIASHYGTKEAENAHRLAAKLIRALITPEATSALDAVKRAERAQALRDAAMAFEVGIQLCTPRTRILAMIPEGE